MDSVLLSQLLVPIYISRGNIITCAMLPDRDKITLPYFVSEADLPGHLSWEIFLGLQGLCVCNERNLPLDGDITN